MPKRIMPLLTLIVVLATVLMACGGSTGTQGGAGPQPAAPPAAEEQATTAPAAEAPTAAPADAPTVVPTTTPVSVSTFDAAAAGDRTVVRWFVGLGTGSKPDQIQPQREVVERFNQSQDEIYLALEIVDNNQAYSILATQIAAGAPPDIIGPIGLRGRNGFKGQLLDLNELIAANNVDLSQYPKELVDFYNVEGQGQIGLPYAIYPSFLYFNKDLFDEAGLPYPPQQFGAQYAGQEWTIETMSELAKQLTVDENGYDATSPDFNPDKVVQFGWHPQWVNNARSIGSLFGADTLVAQDGAAQIPERWVTAWQWYHDGMFKDHFIPHDQYVNSDTFGNTNVFNSGNLAMAWTHIWYLNAIEPNVNVKNWDIAVVPSYEGTATAKLHADTFSIMQATRHPQEAFQALLYLLDDPTLIGTYGAMPAQISKQAEFFAQFDTRFAPNTITWEVATESLKHIDDPSHEEDLPNFLEAQDALASFETSLRNDAELDVPAAAAALRETLDAIFAER
jgi:multiple sugar transport system substrate-binding protein